MKDRQERPPVVILAVGLMRPLQIPAPLGSPFHIVEYKNLQQTSQHLAHERVAVLLLGSRLAPTEALAFLAQNSSGASFSFPSVIALCAGPDPEFFQEFIEKEIIFYLAAGDLPDDQLAPLVVSAADRFELKVNPGYDPWQDHKDEFLDLCIRLPMQEDFPSATKLLVESVHKVITADRVSCLIYDAGNETLVSSDNGAGAEWPDSSAVGLAAFVARTGQAIVLDRISADLRYDPESDNPDGTDDVRFLAQPILGPNKAPLAVIAVMRRADALYFSEQDIRSLALLSECAAPTLGQIALQKRAQTLLLKQAASTQTQSDIFREEALEYHLRSSDQRGDVLKGLPLWLRRTYVFMLIFVCLSGAGMFLIKLKTYASGPALIRSDNAVEISAPTAGIVRSITTSAGNSVKVGDLLMVLEILPQSSVPELAVQVRATIDGEVDNITVHPGTSVKPGDDLLRLLRGQDQYEVFAFLPEVYGPQLHRGMSARLILPRIATLGDTIQIDEVSPEALNTSDMSRFTGSTANGNSIRTNGRVFMIHARLPEAFARQISPSSKLDGIVGEAEVVVGSERVIVALVPGLRNLLER